MLPSNQRQIIQQAKFTYSPLGKALGKQTKTIEDQGIKQVKALKALKSEEELESVEGLSPPPTKKKKKKRTDEIKNEIYEIKKLKEKIKRKYWKHEAGKYKYDFQQYETIRSFGESIYAGKINIHEAEMDETNLLENVVKFNNKSRAKTKEGKNKNEILLRV